MIKCDCERCRGDGEIPCPDCGGTGQRDTDVFRMKIPKEHPKEKELKDIRAAALKLKEDFGKLIKLKPQHAGSYSDQFDKAESELETQAKELLK